MRHLLGYDNDLNTGFKDQLAEVEYKKKTKKHSDWSRGKESRTHV